MRIPTGECELHLCWCCDTADSRGLAAPGGPVDRRPRYSDMAPDLNTLGDIGAIIVQATTVGEIPVSVEIAVRG